MSNSGAPVPGKPILLPVKVESVWSHASIQIAGLMAALPLIIAFLVQMKEIPGLPTNVLAWIGVAIGALTTATRNSPARRRSRL